MRLLSKVASHAFSTYGKDPIKSGKVSSRWVSGGAEAPLCVGWWSNCKLPCLPIRVALTLCHLPFVIDTGDLSKVTNRKYQSKVKLNLKEFISIIFFIVEDYYNF